MTDQKRKGSKKKKKGGSKTKKKMSGEQLYATKCVHEWVYLENSKRGFVDGSSSSSSVGGVDDDFNVLMPSCENRGGEKLAFELHSHSTCSDGFFSPTKLVERAHANGVKVLALTDHDTMSGISEALVAARRFGIKMIPGVEISTIVFPRDESELEEPVHILAYYSSCGPARPEEVEKFLSDIREGRYLRAKNMVSKLNNLKLPLKWEQVSRIAGKGVAPGRLHVARAMVEAGHVENLKQAFSRYLYDNGPAYSTGSEPPAEIAVKFICETGGLAVLAHPWALKNPASIVRRLKEAGLHGIEVYRCDGKLAAYSDLADTFGLLKLGGSDFHGRGGNSESDVGSVNLPVLGLHEFLKVARPIWCSAIGNILKNYAEEPSDAELQRITQFGKTNIIKNGIFSGCSKELIDVCLSSWLTLEEMQSAEFMDIKLKLQEINQGMLQFPIESS